MRAVSIDLFVDALMTRASNDTLCMVVDALMAHVRASSMALSVDAYITRAGADPVFAVNAPTTKSGVDSKVSIANNTMTSVGAELTTFDASAPKARAESVSIALVMDV